MNIESIRSFCLLKKGITEEFPFGEDTLVYKVMGKIFLMASLDGELSLNLKCDPEKATEWREEFPCVTPGYHMNKKHWNTVIVDGTVSDRQVREWIDHSYEQVVQKLTIKQKKELDQLE